MKIKEYNAFNEKKYGQPWICKFENGQHNFGVKVGGYTGAYGKGEEGYIFLYEPIADGVYSYGQKGRNDTEYMVIKNGESSIITRQEALELTTNI